MKQSIQGASMLSGVHVLLVEDDAVGREVIGRLLVDYGAAVTATSRVAEALEAFGRERPHVVLSDIEMPGEDGYALPWPREVSEGQEGL